MNMHIDAVTIEMIEQSEEGVTGWAEIVTTAPQKAIKGAAKTNKPKAKAKSKAAAAPTVTSAEKDVKQLIVREMELKSEVTSIKDKLQGTEQSSEWANAYVTTIDEHFASIQAFRSNSDFLQKFERAVLSPEALKKLKKSGVAYFEELVRVKDSISKPIQAISDELVKINGMAIAAHSEFEDDSPQKKRAKKSSKVN